MPSRADTAPMAIESALANVDHLYLYLDKFDVIPSYAKHERMTILRSQDMGEIGANGKLLGLSLCDGADYYACFDDDILYPNNFIQRLYRECVKYEDRVAVGVHGSVFEADIASYRQDRKVYDAVSRLCFGKRVDVLATCGTLHPIAEMKFDVKQWSDVNMVDLGFAFEAKNVGLGLRVVSRRKRWIQRLGRCQADSIYAKLRQDDALQTLKVKELLGLGE